MAANIEIQDEDDGEDDDDVNYANVQTKTTARLKHPRKSRSVSRRYRLVVLGFGLLCGVQALLNIGLRLSLYSQLVKGQEQMQSRYDNLTKHNDDLQSKYDSVLAERAELKRRLSEAHEFTCSGDVCYYISTELDTWTWEKSRQNCKAKQSDLMIINSKEKQDLVNRVARYQGVWLGLTARETEGVWKWVDGTHLTTPMYWSPDEPNGDGDCVVSYEGIWYDAPCSSNYRWICERVIQ